MVVGLIVMVGAARGAVSTDIATANFDDSTLGPFTADPVGSVTVVRDPATSEGGHGLVARMSYQASATPAELKAALSFTPSERLSLGSTFYFSGDLFIPDTTFNMANPAVARELVMFRAPIGKSLDDDTDAYVMLHLVGGCGLMVQWSRDGKGATSRCKLAEPELGRWNHLELQVTMNRSIAGANGVLRLWFNGARVFQDTAVRLTDPAGKAAPVWRSWVVGATRSSADVDGKMDLSDGGIISEVRYWDNISFSTTRVGSR